MRVIVWCALIGAGMINKQEKLPPPGSFFVFITGGTDPVVIRILIRQSGEDFLLFLGDDATTVSRFRLVVTFCPCLLQQP